MSAGAGSPRPDGAMPVHPASHRQANSCISHRAGLYVALVTVLRTDGLRVVIFVDDHLPAHVHVFGDGQTKINLFGAGGAPELFWADGMTRGEIRRAVRIVIEQQA